MNEVVMLEVLENKVDENGMRIIRLVSSPDVEIDLLKYVPVYLVRCTPKLIRADQVLDMGLRIVTTDISFPVLGPVEFEVLAVSGQRSAVRRLFVVHRYFGSRISECVRLGVEGWMVGTKHWPDKAFVKKLPAGVENGVEVSGCMLFEAEWMMAGCVAVGI